MSEADHMADVEKFGMRQRSAMSPKAKNGKGGQSTGTKATPKPKARQGKGALPSNDNAAKTGERTSIFMDVLSPHERALYQKTKIGTRAALEEQLGIVNIREYRMMEIIQGYRAKLKAQTIGDIQPLIVFEEVDTVGSGEDGNSTRTKRTGLVATILACEEALTRVQSLKQRLIDSLHKMDQDGKGDADESGMKALAAAIAMSTQALAQQGGGFVQVVPPNRQPPESGTV